MNGYLTSPGYIDFVGDAGLNETISFHDRHQRVHLYMGESRQMIAATSLSWRFVQPGNKSRAAAEALHLSMVSHLWFEANRICWLVVLDAWMVV